MCSRYNLTSPAEAVRAYFRHANVETFPPRYNIAPSQPVLIVRLNERGERHLGLVRWGLIPGWVKDPRDYAMLINARSETAATKPSFRGAMRHRRCLVPANGFYEWTGPSGHKQPYLIAKPDQSLLAFAGLHEHWLGPDGSEIDTMAILTCDANATIGRIHDRMPVIIEPENFDRWLNCRAHQPGDVADLLAPARADLLTMIEIDRAIGNSRREGPELILPQKQTLL